MDGEARPPWLVSQENGEIGEARTRAFLLDRFWLLERSVDIEGADFIIQRRITARSLLDQQPPRFGVIQAKYCATPKTTQYVHREYVVNPQGDARPEFFLIVHTGTAEDAKAYLLSASDIVEAFSVAPAGHSHEGKFILHGSRVLTPRYEIMNPTASLRRIERALEDADFRANRYFLSWALPSRDCAEPPIQEAFLEPIDNDWGDIPKEFKALREKARRLRWDLDEVVTRLREVEDSDDPEQALAIADEIKHEWSHRVTLPKGLVDEEMMRVVQLHRKRYTQLKESGTLSAHTFFRRSTMKFIIDDLAPKMPIGRNSVFIFRVQYDRQSLLNLRWSSRVVHAIELWPDFVEGERKHFDGDVPEIRGVLTSTPGDVEFFFLPDRFAMSMPARGKLIGPLQDPPWPEKLAGPVDWVVGELLQHVLELRFGAL